MVTHRSRVVDKFRGNLYLRAMRILLSITTILASGVLAFQLVPPKGFVGVLPSDIQWNPNPTVPKSEYAILLGNPRQAEPLIVRVRMPPNIQIAPHTHPDARTYTVLAGEWKLGFGDTFNPTQLRTFSAGSVYRLPANVVHFQATGASETIIQIESIGPTGTDFVKK